MYSHSVLAFSGLHVWLAMIDLDEYVMSLRDDMVTISDMVNGCPERLQRQQHRALAASGSAKALSAAPGTLPPTNLWVTRFQAYHSAHAQVNGSGASSDGLDGGGFCSASIHASAGVM